MIKKWLYSVALGALLIAGEAMGITVHDVLSNGFFSSEIRETHLHLLETTDYKSFLKKEKMIQDKDGIEKSSFVYITRNDSIMNGTRWKNKSFFKLWERKDREFQTSTGKLTVHRPFYKEKNTMDYYEQCFYEGWYLTNQCYETSSVYTNKPRKKDVRPIGALVLDDWFPEKMTTNENRSCHFFGTEHNAVTNIISDNEAYITGTIFQTGHVDIYLDQDVDEPASLLRTYTQHITTDADHVYVEQEITENSHNSPASNSQNTYQTQYTATFKKGRWKGETETISQVGSSQLADWYINYLKQKHEQTNRVSSHQPDHWTMNQRPRQNSR